MPTSFQMLEHEMRDRLAAKNVEIDCLRAERDAFRSILVRVDEWWTSLPAGLKQDIEGSGAIPGCIAAVLTALAPSPGGEKS